MPPILEQLQFELPDPASDYLEDLLAEEIERETTEELGNGS